MQRNRKIRLFALSLILAFILFSAVSQSEFNPDNTPSHIGIFDSKSPANIITRFPIAYWQMDEASGVDVFDSTLPQVNGHTLGGSTWTSGVVGTCLELLAGQYIEIIDPSSYLNLPEMFTIEAWVNLQNTVGHHTIIDRSNSPSITQYHFAVQDGQLFFEQQLGIPRQLLSSPAFTVTPNQWHHVAVVFRRSVNRVWFYLDGQEDSQTFPAEFVSNPGQVFIGQDLFDPDPGPLIGLIDEVAIYDYTLDLIMIQDHYAKGLIGLGYLDEINSPPVAEDDYYTADEDTPLTVSQPGVLANDYDAEGDPLEAVLETGPSFGTLTLLPDGSFNYIPYPDTAGMDSFTYKAIDAEDVSNIATVTIDVIPDDDRTGPVISIAYTGDSTDANPGTWDVLVYDPESGIQSVLVEVDGISVGTAPGIYSVPGTAGDHTITVTSANADFDTGPQDQETSTLSDTVTIIDVTPPETTITLSGTLGANNWYVSDVTVTLTVNEAATTAYQVNDDPWMMYSGPFMVELEGNVIISFNSTDTTGNREDTKTRQYQVDKTPPVIKLDIEPVPGVGLLVTLTATETGSGLIDMG
ncbi:MAG: LamG-like jellyroll fold domain-containing protein, partial [Candidatus Thorarchaeota archaeon]